jgi:hypothetical protein
MRITSFDPIARALRIAFVGGLIALQSLACSQSNPSGGDDTSGTSGTDSMGAAGDAQGQAGDATTNPAGTGGNQSAGAGGATGKAGAGGAGGTSVPIVDAGPRVGKLKIMPLGDSVTSSTCYRAELAKLLDKSHPSGYQFVGTLTGDFYGCDGYKYDSHHQGMGGYLVTSDMPPKDTYHEAPTWAALAPDVILLHFATNDAWNTIPNAKILAAYTYLVGLFRKTNPRVTIIAAQLIPLNPSTATDAGPTYPCAQCRLNVTNLNAAIPKWVMDTDTPTSRVFLVDQWTGYDSVVDSRDGVHPGPTGSVKMANRWAPALEPLF